MRSSTTLLAAGVLLFASCGEETPEQLERAASDCAELEAVALRDLPPGALLLNAYFLQEEAARSLRAGETESRVLEEVLTKATALGAIGLRTNGFNDAPEKVGDSAIQTGRLEYDETSFRALDLVLTRAHAHDLKLVLPLGNYWDAYGGARRYVEWAGLPEPQFADPRFFVHPGVRDHYAQQLRNVLDRVNTFDGIRYGEHPAILSWELLNEPRGTGLANDGSELRAWIDEMAAVVRERAPGHYVSTGEEGFEQEGTRFRLNGEAPAIDLLSIHLYPEDWLSGVEVARFGAEWIAERARVARELGKPLFLGEFGVRNDGAYALEQRRAIFRGWLTCARRSGVAAVAPWMFANDARPDEWDAYTFYLRDGTEPGDPVNRYADILIEY